MKGIRLKMVRKNSDSKALLLSQASVLIVVILLLCLGRAPAGSTTSAARDPKTRDAVMARKEAALEKILSRRPVSNLQISLEMKENVDFLLTPALLVQEVISHDAVITYPSE